MTAILDLSTLTGLPLVAVTAISGDGELAVAESSSGTEYLVNTETGSSEPMSLPANSNALAVNDSGEAVIVQNVGGPYPYASYTYFNGVLSPIVAPSDFPPGFSVIHQQPLKALDVFANGINDSGAIVGYVTDQDNVNDGFKDVASIFTNIQVGSTFVPNDVPLTITNQDVVYGYNYGTLPGNSVAPAHLVSYAFSAYNDYNSAGILLASYLFPQYQYSSVIGVSPDGSYFDGNYDPSYDGNSSLSLDAFYNGPNGFVTVPSTHGGTVYFDYGELNDSGLAVGEEIGASTTPFLFDGKTKTDLSTLLPSNSPWKVTGVTGIGDNDDIIGTGVDNGIKTVYVLNPSSIGTTTVVTSSKNPSVSGDSVTFTAVVSPSVSGFGIPTGDVIFVDGTTNLTLGVSLDSSGVATFSTSNLTIGSHTITAFYGGDGNYNGSTSNTIDQNVSSPQIVITNLPTDGIFYIGTNTSMPTIDANLVGVTPDLGTTLKWTIEVDYLAADYPNDPGPGEDTSVKYPSEMTTGSQYTPSFKDEDGDQEDSGGTVTISVTATVNGQQVSYQTNAEDDGVIEIEGTNPTAQGANSNSVAQAVENYVATFSQPSNWPIGTQYNFHTIIDQIISYESSFAQFSNGEPKWSSDGLFGVGFTQVTNPAPTIDDIWNWKTNITDGINLFEKKLTDATSYGGTIEDSTYINVHLKDSAADALETQIIGLQAKDGLDSLTLAELTPDQIVRQAIRGFNGRVQFTPAKNGKGILIITLTGPRTGVINWVERNDGLMDYVQNVLSQKV